VKGASPDKGSRTSFAARRVVDEPKEPSREVGVDTAHPGSIGSCGHGVLVAIAVVGHRVGGSGASCSAIFSAWLACSVCRLSCTWAVRNVGPPKLVRPHWHDHLRPILEQVRVAPEAGMAVCGLVISPERRHQPPGHTQDIKQPVTARKKAP